MTTDLFRGFVEPDLHVRSTGDGRTIYGIAIPWNRPQPIESEGVTEQFASHAFDHQLTAPERIWFAREHIKHGGSLIGRPLLVRNDAAGLYFEAKASRTPLGDETVELVKDGALRQVSIMFRERQNRRLGGNLVERVKADLWEIAMVLQGAYGELATAAGVRSLAAADGDGVPGELVTPMRDRSMALRLPPL